MRPTYTIRLSVMGVPLPLDENLSLILVFKEYESENYLSDKEFDLINAISLPLTRAIETKMIEEEKKENVKQKIIFSFMNRFPVILLLGLATGIVDVIPMVLQKLDWYANASAFIQWIVVAIFISYSSMKLKGWIKGLLIAEMAAIPIMILVLANEPWSVLPIATTSALLGSLVGFFNEKLEKKR